MPTMPSPPGLFSTTTDWPQSLASLSTSSRAPMSVPLPGPNVRMKWTVRVGQACCAADGAALKTSATRTPNQIATPAPAREATRRLNEIITNSGRLRTQLLRRDRVRVLLDLEIDQLQRR